MSISTQSKSGSQCVTVIQVCDNLAMDALALRHQMLMRWITPAITAGAVNNLHASLPRIIAEYPRLNLPSFAKPFVVENSSTTHTDFRRDLRGTESNVVWFHVFTISGHLSAFASDSGVAIC
jgi:hypothetical protein